MQKLILASKSPRRQRILKENGFNFRVAPADLNEEKYENLSPLRMAKTLSVLKAKKIANKYKNTVVIGVDTTVDLNGEIIGKPKTIKHAKEILKELSGKTHKVITVFTIIHNGKVQTDYEKTYVTFYKLDDKTIDEYLKRIDVMGFAGAYGIQDGAGVFIRNIRGDYLNIVGLPSKAINLLRDILK